MPSVPAHPERFPSAPSHRVQVPSEHDLALSDRFPSGILRQACGLLTKGLHIYEAPRSLDHISALSFLLTFLSLFSKGPILWVSQSKVHPETGYFSPEGLIDIGIDPERLWFVEAGRARDVLWSLEQSLSSGAIPCVVGEIADSGPVNMTASRRLSLRAQKMGCAVHIMVLGNSVGATCALTRWVVLPVPSTPTKRNWPRWRLELKKNKTGSIGVYNVSYDPLTHSFVSTPSLQANGTSPRQKKPEQSEVVARPLSPKFGMAKGGAA
ncbi:ImuA family protein [Acuticoccus yangtzensis]|uniref:ImuA family protein n=1 Tax=Acuticoccus yangtzensis TaxID=1443441 RepID=UPI000B1E1265|nr:hypothetical protein [Acuticoccus yangtzensis]